jgi:hypothetical protein
MKFEPTYLYIKRHSVTGLLYFGKSSRSEKQFLKYVGSGKLWSPHIKKHGIEHVETLWYCLFFDEDDIKEFALMCSTMWDIVNSDQWVNLKPEDGLEGGGVLGLKHNVVNLRGPDSEETKAKKSAALKNRSRSEEDKQKMRKPKGPMSEEGKRIRSIAGKGNQLGIPKTVEQKAKISASLKGRTYKPRVSKGPRGPQEMLTCPHCGKVGGKGAMKQWHFDKCKTRLAITQTDFKE